MQYGMDIYPYKRVHEAEKGKSKTKLVGLQYYLRLFIYLASAILVSRVVLINRTAPFGIAYLLALSFFADEMGTIFAGLGSVIGVITLRNDINDMGAYISMICAIVLVRFLLDKLSRRKQIAILAIIFFIELISYKLLISKLNLNLALFFAVFETVCIFPLYFIINYSFICLNDLKTKHLFCSEELISLSITIALIISGTWGINLMGIKITNIFALMLILIISYINGCAIGAAAGVAMGIIVGMSSHNMTSYISIYGMCGLIPGLFKETGKWLSGIAFIIASFILIFNSQVGQQFKMFEALISLTVFYLIPQRYYNALALEFDSEIKREAITENYIDRIKGILVERLDSFREVLDGMAVILNGLVDNDKLVQKSKSSALVETLADRVCSTCSMNKMCWKRELHYTYAAFSEIIESYEGKKFVIPEKLKKKCLKRGEILKETEIIMNNQVLNEMWTNKLRQGRELIANEISVMSGSVNEIVEEFNSDIKFNSDYDKRIRRVFDKNGIKFEDLFSIEDKNDRIIVKLTMKSCGGRQYCVKGVLPLINEATGKCMCVNDEGCKIDAVSNNCTVTFEEMPKYYITTCVTRMCKDDEKSNGDSYSFGKLKDGTYMNIISDGMGSGPQAGQESKAVVELIERLAEAGFSKETAINSANSVMSLKFSQNEKFSTVDLCSFDLYTGKAEFFKVGAVASFIKCKDKVSVINSKTLPIGVLDKPDIEKNVKEIKNADIIVMVSDGVIDAKGDNGGSSDWIREYLQKTENVNPKFIAEGIIEKARELGDGRIRDDMTILVSKVFNLY